MSDARTEREAGDEKMTRLIEAVVILTVGLVALVIAYTNVRDPEANRHFLRQVLGTTTIFSDSKIRDRAVVNPQIIEAAFRLSVLTEFLVAGLCLIGSVGLLFGRLRNVARSGLALAWLFWFGGFRGIGGEWFGMWQSKEYNALPDAHMLSTSAILAYLLLEGRK